MNKKIILLFAFLLCGCLTLPAQQVAVKTNMLFWVTGTPNIGAEVALSKHSTISVMVNYNPWTYGQYRKFQHFLIQPEYRYWFSEKFTRCFIGFHAAFGTYDLGGWRLPFGLFPSFRSHYYDGWAVGVGVSLGYQFYIGRHWNLEAVVGMGYARTKYTRKNLDGKAGYTLSRNYIGPTQLGLTFVYLFNSKK